MATIQDLIDQHISDMNNPHGVTKADVGLGRVKNFPIATKEEAFAGNVEERYVTPARLKDVFDGILTRRGFMNDLGQVILPS